MFIYFLCLCPERLAIMLNCFLALYAKHFHYSTRPAQGEGWCPSPPPPTPPTLKKRNKIKKYTISNIKKESLMEQEYSSGGPRRIIQIYDGSVSILYQQW